MTTIEKINNELNQHGTPEHFNFEISDKTFKILAEEPNWIIVQFQGQLLEVHSTAPIVMKPILTPDGVSSVSVDAKTAKAVLNELGRTSQNFLRKTFSLHPDIVNMIDDKKKKRSMKTDSEYISYLIRKDNPK